MPTMTSTTPVRLSGPLDLAACVPTLLGFTPDPGSVVVITLAGKRVGLTMRVDYPGNDRALDALAAQLIGAVGPDVTTVHVVGWETATGEADEVYWRLRNGQDRFTVDECLTVARGSDGAWQVLDTCANVMDDVERTWHPLPVDKVRPAAVVEGVVVRASRDELRELFEPTGEPVGPFDELLIFDLGGTDARDERIAALARLTAEELGPLLDTYAGAARKATGYARDNALVLAAITAYLRGDGAMASVALDYASPEHNLSNLIRQALSVAVPPDALREILLAAA
jgi:hypothetical protein